MGDIASSSEAINKQWLWPVLKVTHSELTFKVKSPGVELTICRQSH